MEAINSIQNQTDIIEAVFIQLEKIRKTNSFSRLTHFHVIFYQLKQKYPKFFERLMFDTNGHTPISEDVDYIFSTFNLCGIKIWAGDNYFINLDHKNLKEICKKLSVSEKRIAEIAMEMNKLIGGEIK